MNGVKIIGRSDMPCFHANQVHTALEKVGGKVLRAVIADTRNAAVRPPFVLNRLSVDVNPNTSAAVD